MASVLRRTEDLQRLKTRELVFQYADGSYPGLYRVAVIDTTLGRVGWAPATIDMSGNMVVPGNLDVSGSATVDGTLTVGSTAYFGAGVDISGTLTVGSTIYALGDLDVSGSATVDGTLTVGSTIYALSYIDVSGSVTIDGTLTVGSTAYFESDVDISGELTVIEKSRIGTDKSEGSSILTVLGRQTVVLDTAAGTTVDTVLQCRYDPLYNSVAPHNFSTLSIFPNQPAGTTSFQIVSFEFDAGSGDKMGTPLILNPDLPGIINGRGNVGVGTTDPQTALDVSGVISLNNAPMFSSGVNSTIDISIPYLTIRSGGPNVIRPEVFTMMDGNVLIHQNFRGLEIKPASGVVEMNAFWDSGGGTSYPLLGNHMALQVDASSGNVGIKTTTPQAVLDVNGSFAVSSLPPASSTDAGITGQITWGFDGGTPYLYLCQAGSSWARVAMAGW